MAWRKFLALGLLATAAFAGCTVTTDEPGTDGGGDGGSSSGGAKGSGGSASGGKSTGGSSSGGSKATGGSSTGGDDGGITECGAGANECDTCVQDKCCQEWLDCGDDPDCSYKSASNPGELICMQNCLIDQFADAGAVDLGKCDSECAVGSAGVSTATSELIACIRDVGDAGVQNCSTVCFGIEL